MANRTVTFNIRLTPAELTQLKLQAKARGWTVGRLIRYRCLTGGNAEEQRVAAMERETTRLGG